MWARYSRSAPQYIENYYRDIGLLDNIVEAETVAEQEASPIKRQSADSDSPLSADAGPAISHTSNVSPWEGGLLLYFFVRPIYHFLDLTLKIRMNSTNISIKLRYGKVDLSITGCVNNPLVNQITSVDRNRIRCSSQNLCYAATVHGRSPHCTIAAINAFSFCVQRSYRTWKKPASNFAFVASIFAFTVPSSIILVLWFFPNSATHFL